VLSALVQGDRLQGIGARLAPLIFARVAVPAPRPHRPVSDLARHDRDLADAAARRAPLPLVGAQENRAQRLGDRQPSPLAGLPRGRCDAQPGARLPFGHLDVDPIEALDLAAPQPAIEGDPVRHLVLGGQRTEKVGGFLRECDALAPLAEVRPEVDVGERVRRDVSARPVQRPRVD
jgi:hypothetical protein